MNSTNEATQIVRDASGCVFFAAMALYFSIFIPSHPVQKLSNIAIATGLIFVSARLEKLEKLLLPHEAIADKQRLITCQEWLEGMEILFENPDDLNQQSQSTAPAPTTSAASATTSATSAHLYQLLYQQSWSMPSAIAPPSSAMQSQSNSTAIAPIFTKIINYLDGRDWTRDNVVKQSITDFKIADTSIEEIQGYLQFLEVQGYLETRNAGRNGLEARKI